MVIKQRAMGSADKEVRRHAILDAAEALFLEHPDRMASVAEVAEAAGLAKGTVYLYFPSKEEMLLALHERHVTAFFDELTSRLEGDKPMGYDEIWEITRRRIIQGPGYLDLTSRCFGLMDREIPVERALQFKMDVGQLLARAGAALERHFPALSPGEGVSVFCNSYGLMVGLWQLMHPNQRFGAAMQRPELRMLNRDFATEVERAVRALWTGILSRNEAASPVAATKGGAR
jgi:AcrR family transcriptional regulator